MRAVQSVQGTLQQLRDCQNDTTFQFSKIAKIHIQSVVSYFTAELPKEMCSNRGFRGEWGSPNARLFQNPMNEAEQLSNSSIFTHPKFRPTKLFSPKGSSLRYNEHATFWYFHSGYTYKHGRLWISLSWTIYYTVQQIFWGNVHQLWTYGEF